MASAFLSLAKLRGAGIVLSAARHNLREIQAELGADSHINIACSCLNQRLAGPATAADVDELARNALRDAGVVKLRKDAVRAVEIVVSLPAGMRGDPSGFFVDALEWVRRFFDVPVLSAVVHLDEAAPHMHVLLLPLQDGRMIGSALVGNRGRLLSMQSTFFDAVARKHGLSRPRTEKRLGYAAREKAARQVLDCLQAHPERLQLPDVCTALKQLVATNPEQLVAALGLELPKGEAGKHRTFVQIMTRPCKPEPKQNPIGFAGRDVNPNFCVGFTPEDAPHSGPRLRVINGGRQS